MNRAPMQFVKLPILSTILVLALAGCGGGGSSASNFTPPAPPSSPPPSPPPAAGEVSWERGVYRSSSEYVAQCVVPRTGSDPFSGEPYPDTAGSALTEKLWLRSWTHETYLWFDEVPDNDPNDFSISAYFDQLVTPERTASGAPKDNFHFSQPTDEYNERTQGGTSSGYGISWQFVSNTAPRELIVRYTEDNSPAALANIPRGASLVRIDGIDFVNSNNSSEIDQINAALFPGDPGAEHTFEFISADGEDFSVQLTSAIVELSPVQNVKVLDTAAGRMGYMQFNTFIPPAQGALIDAFDNFVNEAVTELVVDLRYNGGGSLALASQLAYMIAGPNQTNNRIFEQLRYNSKIQDPQPTPFYDREIDYVNGLFTNNDLPSPELTRVFILSSPETCSASEALINGLKGIDVEVVMMGETTCGKPFGFIPEDNCGTTYFTIQFQGVNEDGFGEYAAGFSPSISPIFDDQVLGCEVDDDFSNALGSPNEAQLAAAIFFAENNECPAAGTAPAALTKADNNDNTGPAIRTPNRFLESIINESRTQITKEPN